MAGRGLPQHQTLVAEVANCLPAVVAVTAGASLGQVVTDAWARVLTLMDRVLLPIRNRQDLGGPGGRLAADWQPGMHPLTQVIGMAWHGAGAAHGAGRGGGGARQGGTITTSTIGEPINNTALHVAPAAGLFSVLCRRRRR